MKSRPTLPRVHGPATAALLFALLAGCASRSLSPPPVVDWSEGAQSARPAPIAAPAAPLLYTVRRDDTLNAIAKRYNVPPSDLAAWNNLSPNARLKIDQVLRISPPAAPPEVNVPVAIPQPVGNETVEQRPLGTAPEVSAAASTSVPLPAPSNVPIKSGPLGIKRPYSDATLAELSRPDGDAAAPAVAPAATAVSPAAAVPASSMQWSWPAAGKPSAGFVEGKAKGLDIPGKAGDAVLAAADGKVTFSGTGVRGYGNFVIVRHSPDLLSVYAHNRANLVKEGAVVTKGQKIAEMGNSDADAVMLHFEIRNDSKPVDPMKYLPER